MAALERAGMARAEPQQPGRSLRAYAQTQERVRTHQPRAAAVYLAVSHNVGAQQDIALGAQKLVHGAVFEQPHARARRADMGAVWRFQRTG